MKVLLTGATGLLGNHIARILTEKGYSVRAIVREKSDLSILEGLNIEFVKGQITDTLTWQKALQGCGALIHAATDTSQLSTRFKAYREIHIKAVKTMIEAATVSDLKKLVYVSTANCFGSSSKGRPAHEGSGCNMEHYGSAYVNTKLESQRLILQSVAEKNLPAVVVNPAFMLGSHDPKPSSGQIILHFNSKKIIFYPPGGKSIIHVRDAATACVNALEKGKSGECYLLANENMTFREFIRKLNIITGNKAVMIPLPKWFLLFSGAIGSSFELLLNRPVQLNLPNARLLCAGLYYSSEKARKELSMPVTPADIAIRDTVSWFVETGRI